MKSIRRLLIANRGEISVRIAKTCKKQAIHSIAIYSEEDKHSLHTTIADEALLIESDNSNSSPYLSAKQIIEAAVQSKADAIHPGYGYLSENANFAKQVQDAGLIFVGPDPSTLRILGSKSLARDSAIKAGIPVVPGSSKDTTDFESLSESAETIGYPVILKATAGGGGRGMRLIADKQELLDSLDSAKREAKAAFSDDSMIIEKFVQDARHIEVQIIGDNFGNIAHIFERECSIQRRNQKIIEECPAPNLEPELRQQLFDAAVTFAKAVSLHSLCTIEFLVDAKGSLFYFLEANPRIQVEHPVTEMVSGCDLVWNQLQIANGCNLNSLTLPDEVNGHAIEARIYAELPYRNFFPSQGSLWDLSFPKADYLRVDHALKKHQSIKTEFDPLVAKVIAHGPTRSDSLIRLHYALENTRCTGLDCNLAFLINLLQHPDMKQGNLNTRFIDNNPKLLEFQDSDVLVSAALCAYLGSKPLLESSDYGAQNERDPFTKWPYWSIENHVSHQIYDPLSRHNISIPAIQFKTDCSARLISWYINQETDRVFISVEINGKQQHLYFTWQNIDNILSLVLTLNGKEMFISFKPKNVKEPSKPAFNPATLFIDNYLVRVTNAEILDSYTDKTRQNTVLSPLPGKVLKLLVSQGQMVKKGQGLIVIESMKMEHTIVAKQDAYVKLISSPENSTIAEGEVLLELEKPH